MARQTIVITGASDGIGAAAARLLTEIHRRYAGQGIAAGAFHPGNIAGNFAAQSKGLFRFVYNNPMTRRMLSSPEKGGAALARLADQIPGVAWLSGEYYENNKIAKTSRQATSRWRGSCGTAARLSQASRETMSSRADYA
jgi:NAD(P)-dependent dehydrogenase (short-subunit alcohol dehydrogenase family)